MVPDSSAPWQAFHASFLQILSLESETAAQECFSFFSPQQRVAWIRTDWKIYAPRLWAWAKEKKIQLVGLQSSPAPKRRLFWKELFESDCFDIWVLDHLRLRAAEGFFLRSLLRHRPLRVIVLEDYPQVFCPQRLSLRLSHLHMRCEWQKGRQPEIFYRPSSYLIYAREDFLCSP